MAQERKRTQVSDENPIEVSVEVLKEIKRALRTLDPAGIERLVEDLSKARQIFCLGAGRSGILLRAFCMRLNHLGFNAYMAGGLPCPPAGAGDLIVVASGSGKTPSVLSIMKNGRVAGAKVTLFTTAESDAASLEADAVIRIAAPSGLVNSNDRATSQPMRSLFEQVVFIACETMVSILKNRIGLADEVMATRHANLE